MTKEPLRNDALLLSQDHKQLSPVKRWQASSHTVAAVPPRRVPKQKTPVDAVTQSMDPIVIERSLAFLDVAAGGSNASVSKAWRSVCGSWALWHDLSQPLRKWKNIAVDARLHPREFCRLSIADAKRTSLTRDELCSQTWRFRFTRAAGVEWLAVDPYWTDNTPATITFTADGTTERAGTWELEVEVKWRWGHARRARRAPGVAGGESGSSVRVVVDGRDVPTLQVARHPVHKGS